MGNQRVKKGEEIIKENRGKDNREERREGNIRGRRQHQRSQEVPRSVKRARLT